MNPARTLLGNRLYDHIYYRHHHRVLMHRLGVPQGKAEGEGDYLRLWRSLSPWVDPYCYRLYSTFCGPTPYIIPFDLLHNIVEPRLNPPALWRQYEDKNRFHLYVDPEWLPTTVASRSHGGAIEYRYPLRSIHYPLIVKPALDSSCGEGILRFDRVGERYVCNTGVELTDSFLRAYGPDFVLQEAVSQHPFMSRLCPTAVCTLRLATYRSFADGRPHVTAAVLRVGKDGAVVDNIVAGGRFVGVDINSGTLGDAFIARYGERTPVWNGVDLRTERLVVPGWDRVKDLALAVAEAITDHRLVAHDIALSENGKPMLIEYNIGGFSSYLFHFSGQTVFGPYTEELVKMLGKG